MTYCEYIRSEAAKEIHVRYHDREYGFPITDDNLLFERLVLEINQAGLSWETILRKQEGFRAAFNGFDVLTVAQYTDEDVARLLADSAIIRNRLKVNAAIENARRILQIQSEFGSFANWLAHHHPKPKAEWVKLFKKTFKFTGGEIVGEFLMSIGYLPDAHDDACPVGRQIIEMRPPWSLVDPEIYRSAN